MSPLTRFMNTATAILNAQDRNRLPPSPHRPPIFVRTNYLFVEIDEALIQAQALAAQIKVARLKSNIAETTRLNGELRRVLRQLAQLTGFVKEQFDLEGGDAN